MTAQEGLFINYFRGRGNDSNLFNKEGKIKTLDEYIFDKTMDEKPFRLISERIGKPMLFTFPQTYMGDIHEKLDSININWYTI